jgi:hypothetical protein
MMKKLMTLLLVFAMTSAASAALIELHPLEGVPGSSPENPLPESEYVVIPVYNPTQHVMVALDAELTVVSGAGSITGAISKADAAAYGWDPATSFDPDIAPSLAEFGVGNFSTNAALILGYYIIHCDGEGDVVVRLGPGTKFGGSFDLAGPVTDIGGTITIYQIPEPMTVALLGLGGLALLRRRK